MTQALLLKEWLKTRRSVGILLAITVLITAYIILGIQRTVTTNGVNQIWSFMLLKDSNFVGQLRYFPLLCGIVIGATQMLPEMQHRRLKLTLHLPYNQNAMVGLMLSYGTAVLLLMFALQLGSIAAYYATKIASQMTLRVVLTMLPWYLCGLNAYLFTAAVCLESGWRLRVIISLTGFALTALFFAQEASEAYNGIIWLLLLVIVAAALLPYYSIYRFKEGRQD